jgi:RNA polymerase sigma factor (TIGR02999 family)
MRQILVDNARRHGARKRGSRAEQVPLESAHLSAPETFPALEALAVHEALDRLAEHDTELARIVELRIFGGFTEAETAEMLGMGASTIRSRWALARAWLEEFLTEGLR